MDSPPAIDSDGTIYVGSVANLYAINPDGTEKWRFTTNKGIVSSPMIGDDGTVYFGTYGGNLYAINPDGTEKWRFKTGDLIGMIFSLVAVALLAMTFFTSWYHVDMKGETDVWGQSTETTGEID